MFPSEKMKRSLKYKMHIWAIVPAFFAVLAILGKAVNTNEQNLHYKRWNKSLHSQGPGPWVLQTHGKIWPKPQLQTNETEVFFMLTSTNFSFKVFTFVL